MKMLALILILAVTMMAAATANREMTDARPDAVAVPAPAAADDLPLRFLAVDVMIETKDQPLAVYQLEFAATKGDVKIAGIEGSAHEAFREPPHFDPQAMQQNRVIIAAFNTAGADKLPRGSIRIATIHLQVTGHVEPVFEVKPSVIATVDGQRIEAAVTVETKRMPL